jgi:uncharacterized membrane protein
MNSDQLLQTPPSEKKNISIIPPTSILIIIAGMFILSFVLLPYLPDIIPTHWGLSGKADGFSPKAFGAFFAPVLALAIAVLFPVFQRMDPKRESYENFQKTWERLQIGIIAFFAYIHIITLFAGMYSFISDRVGMLITSGMGILFILIGNSMGKIEQNWFVGLRTPWTLSDPEIWRKSQRMAGLLFVIGGIIILSLSLTVHSAPILFIAFISSTLAISVIPILYSYFLAQKKKK